LLLLLLLIFFYKSSSIVQNLDLEGSDWFNVGEEIDFNGGAEIYF